MVDVSVVITTYGRYNYIGEAIESVLKQTMKPREVVVVADDPDRVPYRDRVYVVDRGRDRRYGPAVLKGVEATTSDAIALLEDDDKFHPDKLRVVSRILEKYPAITAVHNHRTHIDVNGKPIDDNDPRVRHFTKQQPGFTLLLNKHNAWKWHKRYGELHHNVSSMVIRRGVFERHRSILRDVELMLDFVLFVLSINDGYYLHIPKRLTIFRVGSGTTTMSVRGDPARVRSQLCVGIRHFHDQYLLLKYVEEPNLKRLVAKAMARGIIIVYWVYGWLLDCGVAVPISAADVLYFSVLKRLELVNDLSDVIRLAREIPGVLLSVLDRKRYAEIRLRRTYGIDLQSLLNNDQRQPSP